MSSQQCRSLSLVRNQVIRPLCRPSRLLTGYRMYNSSQPNLTPNYRGILVGLFGASVAVAGVYTWYQSSHLKKAVDAVQRAKVYLEQTRQNLSNGHQTKTVEAFRSLQQAAKAYVSVLPGADIVVDRAFNSASDAINTHAEEANVIVTQTYQEVLEIVQRDDKGTVASASKILGVLKRRGRELRALDAQPGSTGPAENLPMVQPDGGMSGNPVMSKGPNWKVEESRQKVKSIPRNLFSRSKQNTSPDDAPQSPLETKDENNNESPPS